MTSWKSTIKIGDIHKKYQDKEITIEEVGKQVAARAKLNRFIKQAIDIISNNYESEIDEAIENLEEGIENPEEYDYHLNNLYNFGDYGKRIWFDPSS